MFPGALDFIEALDRKSSTPELIDELARVLASYGVERILVSGLAEQRFEASLFATNWPAEYLELFIREQYVRHAPVARRCRRSSRPFEWRAADFNEDPDPRGVEAMQRAAEFGIAHGFAVPVHGPKGFAGSVGLSGVVLELPPRVKPAIHLVALYAFERARDLAHPVLVANLPLTAREREVLVWAAVGKSAWETAEILRITKRTVDEHAQTAFRKLGAVNRTHAVAIALRTGLINV